jgi:hypothetical protein
MTAAQRQIMDDATWLRSIQCEGIRGIRDRSLIDMPSPELLQVLRAASARRAAIRAEARRSGDKVAEILA